VKGLLREELAAQRAKTEAAEAELKRQKEEHGQAERKLEVLHKKVLDLSPDESPVAGQGGSLQAVLSRNASPLAAGQAHDTARELAILNQRVTTVAGEVVVSKESIARLQQRADTSAQKPAKPAKKEESDKCLMM